MSSLVFSTILSRVFGIYVLIKDRKPSLGERTWLWVKEVNLLHWLCHQVLTSVGRGHINAELATVIFLCITQCVITSFLRTHTP